MCRQGIRRRLRQETRGSEGNLCPLTTQLSKYSPVRLRGGYFFILSYPSVVQIFIGFLLSGLPICITPCNSITQIPTRLDTGGVLFYSLLFVHCTNLYWLPIIWITHLHYPVQLDYANTHPFRYRGGTFLLSLIRPLYKSLLASYYLDYPFQPDYANPPVQMRGEYCMLFFSFRRNTLYIFLLPLYGDSWGFPIISTAQNNLVP